MTTPAGALRFRELPERQPGSAECLPPHDFEDERAAEQDRLGFVLHLGDFIYEIVWYPEDRPQGMYDRRIRDIVRYPHGEKIRDFHIPTTVEDYRAIYRALSAAIRTCRMRAPAGRSSTCGTTTSSAGSVGKSLQRFEARTRPRRRAKWRPTKRFSNTNRRE